MKRSYIIIYTMCIIAIFLMNSVFGIDLSRMRIAHPSGSGEIFHGGVYIYDANSDVMMENHIRLMAQKGMTHLYAETANVDGAAQWCRKYRTYISFQHDYFTGTETPADLAAKACSAASLINNLLVYPEYLTSCVREEPPSSNQTFIDGLFNYYSLINSYFSPSTAPIYLLHDWPDAADKAFAKSFKPIMTGYDRTYINRWYYDVPVNGNLGYLASPRKALVTINFYLNEFASDKVDSSIQWPAAVFLGVAAPTINTKSYLESTYGTTAYQRWLSLSQYNGGEGNQGLKESGGNILNWDFYMPPPNCMSCQVWLGVAKGYRAVFIWCCAPFSNGAVQNDLMGPDHKGTATLDEFGKTVRELQKYGWLINRMQYQSSAAYISYTDSPAYTIYSGSLAVPGYSGKVAVLVNGDVATWSSDTPLYFNDNHVFRFDNYGNVNSADYTAKTTARSIAITNNVVGTPNMYDLETGTLIGSSSGSINVLPGKGKFIFIGSSAELAEIRAKCGMTTITAYSGLVPNRETEPTNIQICDAVNPIISNSLYELSYNQISLNKRYRLHVTAKSSNGAQLGALPGYYDGNWNTYNINCVDSSVLWNKTLTSTPTTFVSQDFTVSSGTQAAIFLWRSNNQGTIQVDDAWLEDCDETPPANIQIYYAVDPMVSSSLYQLSYNQILLNKRYRLHVTAKSSNGAQLGALPGYYDGNWNTYNINCVDSSVLWNKTLTSTPTTFVSQDFTVSSGTQTAIFLWRSNNQGTIQIDDAWLEDCDSHRQIDTEWMNNSIAHAVNNGETYQVYARVRNYPYTNTTFSVKIYEYDSSDTLLGYYDTTPAITNETLTEQPTVFKGTFQRNNVSAHHVRVKFIKSSGSGTVMLESACVGRTNP